MKRWLRAVAALVKDPALIASTPMLAHNHLYISSLGVISWHLWYHMYMVAIHTCRQTNTHTHKMNVTMSKEDFKK